MSATINSNRFVFEEVRIGTQIWMNKNYDFGGTYPNNNESNVTDYGRLYTWAEAMVINFPGWHLPTMAEMNTLLAYVGGSTTAGGFLKEIGTTYWTTPNTGATNSFGFNARGAGTDETFFGTFSQFWASTEFASEAWILSLTYNSAVATSAWKIKTSRCSVRLIKD
jgi:uncharacterized protein (TIGR02145 family)